MKKVYFVRHGESEGNVRNEIQYPTEELSDEGVRQAEFVAKRFASIPIEIILSSTMRRAEHTAEKIAGITRKELIKDDVFGEVTKPTSLLGKTKNEPEIKAMDDLLLANFGNAHWKHSDEENFYALQERAKKALALILERPEENIAVVTHGFILRMMFAVVLMGDNLTPEIFMRINSVMKTFNTGITKMQYDERGWMLLAWNDHAHLG